MRFTPLRISVTFFVFATFWIFTTDHLLEWWIVDLNRITGYQTIKGFLFITITTLFLYFMVKSYESSLKSNQELIRKIISVIPVMITVYKPNISEFSVNREFEKVMGWSNEEASKVNLMEKVYPDEEYRNEVQEFMENPDGNWKDIEVVTRDGKQLQTTWTNIRLNNDTQIGIGIDISERKKIEQELRNKEEWLKLSTTSSNVGMWEWHPQTGVVKIDELWAELVGYTIDELQPVSIDTWNRLVHPDDLIVFEQAVEKYFRGETSIYECEVRMRHKNGEWVWILDRGKTVEWDSEGNPKRLVGTHVDITYRKKIEEQVEREKFLFKTAVNLVSDIVYDWHIESDTVIWNDGITIAFGYPETKVEENLAFWLERLHPEDKARVVEGLDIALHSNREIWTDDYRLLNAEGEPRYVKDNAYILRNTEGKAIRMIGAINDLTSEKQTSELLEYQANLLQIVNDAVISTDENFIIISWNKAAEQTYGWKEEEVKGKYIGDMLPTSYYNTTEKELYDTLLNIGDWSGEIIQKTKGGTYKNILSSVKMIYNENNESTGIVAINRDITNRIEVERENMLLGDLFRRSNTGLAITNHRTNQLERVNQAYANLFGYTMDEMVGMDIHELYPSEKLKDIEKKINTLNKKGFITFESKLQKKDGKTFFGLINLSIFRDEFTASQFRISTIIDISQIKEFERQLAEEQKRFEIAANIVSDVIWEWNPEKQELWWGEGIEVVFGFKKEQYEGDIRFWHKQIADYDKDRVITSMIEAEKSDDAMTWESKYDFIDANGNIRKIKDSAAIIRDRNGVVKRIIGSMLDYTADVRAREELRASEEQYRLLFDQSPLPMFIYDPQTLLFVTANQSVLTKYGYSIEELKSMKIYMLHPEEDLEAIQLEIKRSLQYKQTDSDIWPQITKQGEKIIAEISGTDITYDGRKLRLVIANDITRQKKAEERAISAIVEGEERERQRIAKELHDGLGQYLSASNMNLKSVYEDLGILAPDHSEAFESGLRFLNHAISEIRNISQNLLPKAIQDYGLELAAESLINHLQNNNNIKFYFYKNLGDILIPDNIQINLYRILQEALNNAIKHGNPEKIDVQLVYSENELFMTIEDNGNGFNVNEKMDAGIGLRSIKTRVGAMSANLDITSKIGRGTIISVVVPLNDNLK